MVMRQAVRVAVREGQHVLLGHRRLHVDRGTQLIAVVLFDVDGHIIANGVSI